MSRILAMPQCLSKNGLFYKSFPCRFILKRIKLDFAVYFKKFSKTLVEHFENEFEVQIRGGIITDDGEKILDKLGCDFASLQFEDNIQQILRIQKKKHKTILDKSPHMYDLLDVVQDDVILEVRIFIFKTQKLVLKNRRLKTNLMCDEKCSTGPSVFNFTNCNIHPSLMSHLKSGLKNVPIVQNDTNKLVSELENEAVSACKEMFRSCYGYYPQVSSHSLDKSLIGIISQCCTNSELVGQLSDFRQSFVENLPFFLSSLPRTGLDIKQLIAMIPEGCIITNSDKNVGISILSPEWYAKEYQIQITKGGHEFVDWTETKCLAHLSNKITDFKNNVSPVQRKLLDSLWPKKKIMKHRIGVMKLVPKVSKHNICSCIYDFF